MYRTEYKAEVLCLDKKTLNEKLQDLGNGHLPCSPILIRRPPVSFSLRSLLLWLMSPEYDILFISAEVIETSEE